ncbi:hypothetical protein Pmani_005458 [Petrolisthes manimaculis]|uniref:Uncharacterized protein n=1 Tax=Petrolisthes manimaculis TaxID=1843537 RepID=A0AAE1QCM4_9EUCA|nr:hypothetical protein Pmani_005458 [Petrolisthes manimaculis]
MWIKLVMGRYMVRVEILSPGMYGNLFQELQKHQLQPLGVAAINPQLPYTNPPPTHLLQPGDIVVACRIGL